MPLPRNLSKICSASRWAISFVFASIPVNWVIWPSFFYPIRCRRCCVWRRVRWCCDSWHDLNLQRSRAKDKVDPTSSIERKRLINGRICKNLTSHLNFINFPSSLSPNTTKIPDTRSIHDSKWNVGSKRGKLWMTCGIAEKIKLWAWCFETMRRIEGICLVIKWIS